MLGNVEAMQRAIDVGAGVEIGVGELLEIHRLLLGSTADRAIAGVVRERQNWIGGNAYNPLEAAFVPPPPELVPELLDDLCRFIARGDLPPVVEAAIAHAQFETIHPFIDGNGRTGRALIYAVLRRRGEVTKYIPPISLLLAADQGSYIAGLDRYRAGAVGERRAMVRGSDRRRRAGGGTPCRGDREPGGGVAGARRQSAPGLHRPPPDRRPARAAGP